MSIEENIERIAAALETIVEILIDQFPPGIAPVVKESPKPETVKSPRKKRRTKAEIEAARNAESVSEPLEPDPDPDPVENREPKEAEYSLGDVKDEFRELMRRKGEIITRKTLADFGATKCSDLKPKFYGEAISKAQELLRA